MCKNGQAWGGKRIKRILGWLRAILRTAPGRRGGITQRPHGHYSAACQRGAGDEVGTAGEVAGYDRDRGPMMMGKLCERRAHQSMIGSQGAD